MLFKVKMNIFVRVAVHLFRKHNTAFVLHTQPAKCGPDYDAIRLWRMKGAENEDRERLTN